MTNKSLTYPIKINKSENEVPSGTINGSNVNFSLTNTPISGTQKLYLNGMRLKATDDYTIASNTLTFTSPPIA